MNIVGKLHAKLELQQVTPTFRKREFVVEYSENPMYPQFILFQLVQDRCALIDGYSEGDMIDVSFNLRGRQWNSPSGETKFFNSLEAWRINPAQAQMGDPAQAQMGHPGAGAQAAPANSSGASPAQSNQPAMDVTQMGEDDDLPF